MPGIRSPGLVVGLWLTCAAGALFGTIAVRDARAKNDHMIAATAAEDAVEITADWSQEWKSGDDYVGVFRGHCRLNQGTRQWTANRMVVWSGESSEGEQRVQKLTVYLEDRVEITEEESVRQASVATAELYSRGGVTLTVRGRQLDHAAEDDALFRRALNRRTAPPRGQLKQTQFTVENESGPMWQSVPLPSPGGVRSIRIFQRSALPFDVDSRKLTNREPPEQVTIVSGGVTILISGLSVEQFGDLGTIDLSADRAIVWTDALSGDGPPTVIDQSSDSKCQVYLEGNIVIRQGDNVVRAERAYYDARANQALVLNAELQAFFPLLGSAVRLRAERLRQHPDQSYHAQNAWVTTSQYGKPGYRVEATDIFVEQRPVNLFGGQTAPQIDPVTGEQIIATQPWTTVLNSRLYLDDVPVFYLPYATGTPEDITTPLQAAAFQQDQIFGSQFLTKWDSFSLLGMNRPEGVRWYTDLNYYSQRGPSIGTDGAYESVDAWGNPIQGGFLASYIYDHGDDNLGLDRRSLTPSDDHRGRINVRHRTFFSLDTIFQGELGFVSDRNYLEQYYESEFDRGKDQETLGYLKHTDENWAGSLLIRPQVNPFEYNTQWLPRGDIYALGEPLGDSILNWSMHSSIGYASLNNVQRPSDPNDILSPLPFYQAGEGAVAMSRQELAAPFNAGALKITPYALGEAASWGDSFTNESRGRLYGRTGVRASLMAQRIMPYVQSDLFNLNGLAHKMVFSANYAVAGATESLNQISQWNEFDDDAQERFRERLLTNTFAGTLPPWFDPRNYAVRSAAATSVTAPYHELVANQHVLALGWNHRLQTKVGPPDRLRLKDWMTLDLGANFYPAANRDNFGEDFGLLSARYAWNVGDRTTLLANTLNDTFDGGQQIWNLGVLTQRSYRGSLYVGLRQIRGASLDSEILTASYSYVMTPDKWVSTMFTAYDLAENRNRGQSLTVTRIGESFLFHVGVNFDASKDNVGFSFSVEPKFGPYNYLLPAAGSLMGINQ